MKRALVFLFITMMLVTALARAEDGKEYEQFLKKRSGFYGIVINYLRQEQKAEKAQPLNFNDSLVLFGIDLAFSLFCLSLALLLLVGKKVLSVKNFFWFLFILNFSWFMFLLVYRMSWDVLDFLVMRLRPDLIHPISDSFCFIIIIISIAIYIWLLARTFHLGFNGSLGVFLVSHLFYLSVIFLVFTSVNLGEDNFFNLCKENLGLRPIIHTYLSDVNKISSSQNILSLVRVRPYHL